MKIVQWSLLFILVSFSASALWNSSTNLIDPVSKAPLPQKQHSEETQSSSASFGIRGVIEGFYGSPWSHEQRLAMLDFMGKSGFNTYVYAPKDDPWQRLNWSVPYPEDKIIQMKDLVHTAASNKIAFVYAISPGIPLEFPGRPVTAEMVQKSITFSAETDRRKLYSKIDQLEGVGIHDFMLLFDDVKLGLKTEDTKTYGSDYAKAHVELANQLLAFKRKQDPSFQLWFSPTNYFGLKDNHYWEVIRTQLDPAIQVIWTGPAILSKSITSEQAEVVTKLLGRKPLIWDNYPVNDFTYEIKKHPELFLGPIMSRSSDLYVHSSGMLANPMIQSEASKIALFTMGDYLLDPKNYNPNQSWKEAINHIEGVNDSEALALFARYSRKSMLDDAPNQEFETLVNAFWKEQRSGKSGETRKQLYQELKSLADLPVKLKQSVQNTELLREIAPWATKLSQEGQAGLFALDVVNPNLTEGQQSGNRKLLVEMIQLLDKKPEKIGEEVLEFARKVASLK